MKELLKLVPYLKKYKGWLSMSILSNVFLSIFTVISVPLIIPFFQILFDQGGNTAALNEGSKIEVFLRDYFFNLIQESGKSKALIVVCTMIVAVFFMRNLFRYLALFFMAPVRNGIVSDLRQQLFDKYVSLPAGYYSKVRRGDLISRVTSDVMEIEWSILNVIEAIFKAPLIIAGCLAFMFFTSLKLTVFVFILFIVVVVIIGSISQTLKKTSVQVQSRLGDLTSMVEESIHGLKVIQGFGAQDFVKDRFAKENIGYRDLLNRLLWRRDLSVPISEFMGVAVVAILLWYGTNLVFAGELLPATFFAFVFAFYQVIEPGKSLSSAFYNVQKGGAALQRIEEVLHSKEEEMNEGSEVNSFDHAIDLENVSFKYPGEEYNAVDGISLTIKKGNMIALVGASGSGKSTLADLIMRFVSPDHGVLKLDGKDIQRLRLKDYRKLFGFVTQEALLFNDTIRNNIVFNSEFTSEEKVSKSADIANASEFIQNTGQGFDSSIGDKGMKLSGGQRQRLTIARAIYKNPEIFIFDEATSALDSASELLIQDALEHIMAEKTVIVIAHRLSTIKKADQIIVLERGKIVEQGNHQDLLNANGMYYNMIEKQKFAD